MAVSLDELARHIAELKSLQREYASRQKKLAVLKHRARKLQNKLQQVQGQIEALAQGSEPATPLPKRPAAEAPAASLADLIIEIVRAAGGPIRVLALAEEVKRRNFPTTSKDIHNLVGSKVTQLVQQGILRRTPRRGGVVLRKAKAAAVTKTAERNGQESLRDVLTNILSKSRRPLSAQELEEEARASGYETRSKNFRQIIWTTLGKMDVERVPDQGFRLKK